ncbi:MAG: homoserine O-acetyltransferase [Pseudomonadota bacterium]
MFRLPEALALESGEVLPDVRLAYRTWGTLNAAGDNAVLVCHALTGSADADNWWPGLIGEGAPLDPARDFIVCSNVLGGCYGSSGPFWPNADGSGDPVGTAFPEVTVRDMVRAQHALINALSINKLKLVIGPSLGGMQVMEWAASYPDLVGAIAPIGVSARHSAWCIGIGEAQRQAIGADPNWRDGRYRASAIPARGLAAARMMAMVTYRSWENFESRFPRAPDQTTGFDVQSYLSYQGDKLVERFDAASYYRLTQAMDSHDISRGRFPDIIAALRAIVCPALIVSVSSDVLYPPHEQGFMASHMPHAVYRTLESPHGHDGFLIDLAPLSELINEFLAALPSRVSAA